MREVRTVEQVIKGVFWEKSEDIWWKGREWQIMVLIQWECGCSGGKKGIMRQDEASLESNQEAVAMGGIGLEEVGSSASALGTEQEWRRKPLAGNLAQEPVTATAQEPVIGLFDRAGASAGSEPEPDLAPVLCFSTA